MTDNVTLSGKVVEKKLLIQQQLKSVVDEHNNIAQRKEELLNQAKALQGALDVLQELDNVSNTSSNPEPT